MRNLFIILTMFFTIGAQANEQLEASMKIIGENFQELGKALQSQSLNDSHLAAAEAILEQVNVASQVYPDLATTEESKKLYDKWMDDLLTLAIQLETNIQTYLDNGGSDMQPVIETFMAMNELRKEAHDEFKE